MSKKNFCLLQILIASILVVSLLANTYAWSDRGSQWGSKLTLNYNSVVNGKIDADKVVTYLIGSEEDVAITSFQEQVSDGQVINFKTVVTNTGTNPCNVSLLLKEVSYALGFTVRVSDPTHEYRVYENVLSNDWVRVVPSCEVPAREEVNGELIPGKIEFRWSIEVIGSGELTIGEFVLENF